MKSELKTIDLERFPYKPNFTSLVILSLIFISIAAYLDPKWDLFPFLRSDIVTIQEYNQIKDNMSYMEVVQIIGENGIEVSRTNMDGQGVMQSLNTVSYKWVNENGSNCLATFMNDRLKTIAQSGLK